MYTESGETLIQAAQKGDRFCASVTFFSHFNTIEVKIHIPGKTGCTTDCCSDTHITVFTATLPSVLRLNATLPFLLVLLKSNSTNKKNVNSKLPNLPISKTDNV